MTEIEQVMRSPKGSSVRNHVLQDDHTRHTPLLALTADLAIAERLRQQPTGSARPRYRTGLPLLLSLLASRALTANLLGAPSSSPLQWFSSLSPPFQLIWYIKICKHSLHIAQCTDLVLKHCFQIKPNSTSSSCWHPEPEHDWNENTTREPERISDHLQDHITHTTRQWGTPSSCILSLFSIMAAVHPNSQDPLSILTPIQWSNGKEHLEQNQFYSHTVPPWYHVNQFAVLWNKGTLSA